MCFSRSSVWWDSMWRCLETRTPLSDPLTSCLRLLKLPDHLGCPSGNTLRNLSERAYWTPQTCSPLSLSDWVPKIMECFRKAWSDFQPSLHCYFSNWNQPDFPLTVSFAWILGKKHPVNAPLPPCSQQGYFINKTGLALKGQRMEGRSAKDTISQYWLVSFW